MWNVPGEKCQKIPAVLFLHSNAPWAKSAKNNAGIISQA